MARSAAVLVEDLEFGQAAVSPVRRAEAARTPAAYPAAGGWATPLDRLLGEPDKYRILDLRRRRAQIRARRELDLA